MFVETHNDWLEDKRYIKTHLPWEAELSRVPTLPDDLTKTIAGNDGRSLRWSPTRARNPVRAQRTCDLTPPWACVPAPPAARTPTSGTATPRSFWCLRNE